MPHFVIFKPHGQKPYYFLNVTIVLAVCPKWIDLGTVMTRKRAFDPPPCMPFAKIGNKSVCIVMTLRCTLVTTSLVECLLLLVGTGALPYTFTVL